MVQEGVFIGYIISNIGIKIDKAKVEMVGHSPPITSMKDVRSFLGHVIFYGWFIKEFSKIIKPSHTIACQGCAF